MAAPSSSGSAPSRIVHCADALVWLQEQQPGMFQACSFITSLPDISEVHGQQQPHGQPLTVPAYRAWFTDAAAAVLNNTPDDGVAIFFQTDIKVADGTVLSKAALLLAAAEKTGHELLWHKVVCRVPPGIPTWGKPGFSNMLCFSRGLRLRDPAATSTADVLPEAGDTTWTRGMGTAACAAACRFVRDHTASRTIVDPFAGHGTVLAVANELGLNAVGVEISPKRARQAQLLTLVAGLKLRGRGAGRGAGSANGCPGSSSNTAGSAEAAEAAAVEACDGQGAAVAVVPAALAAGPALQQLHAES